MIPGEARLLDDVGERVRSEEARRLQSEEEEHCQEDHQRQPAEQQFPERGAGHAASPAARKAVRMMASWSNRGAGERADDLAPAHHQDAIAHRHRLLDLGGDQQDAATVGGEPVDHRVDLQLGGDVDAARRLVEDDDRRAGHQPLGDDDLLLVAARQALDRRLGDRSGLDAQRCGHLAGAGGEAGVVDDAERRPAEPRQRGERDVAVDRHVHHQAFLAAVLGEEGHARGDGAARGHGGDRRAADDELAAVEGIEAEEDPGELGAARTHQAEEADDLARR